MQHLNQLTAVISAPQYGGRGIRANTTLNKDDLVLIYGGRVVTEADNPPDTYLVGAIVEGKKILVDGTPTSHLLTDFTRAGLLMNTYGI